MKASSRVMRRNGAFAKRAPDATRIKLLRAARRMFAQRGYQATTVRDICASAGANVALVNYYFGGKKGLYMAVLRDFMEQSSHLVNVRSALDRNAPPEEIIRSVVKARLRGLCPGVLADQQSRILMHELAQPTPALTRVINDLSRPIYERMLALAGGMIGLPAHHEKTRLCVHSVMGQMIVYALARPFLVRLWPELKMTPAQLDRIADHIADFSLAYLTQAGNKRRKVAAKYLFIQHVASSGLSGKTIRRHVDNLWLLGGEIIRDLNQTPSLRKVGVERLLRDLIHEDGGPLIHNDSRLISGMLYGVSSNDPLVYGGASLIFALVALAACLIPARRAARIDPISALRYE